MLNNLSIRDIDLPVAYIQWSVLKISGSKASGSAVSCYVLHKYIPSEI